MRTRWIITCIFLTTLSFAQTKHFQARAHIPGGFLGVGLQEADSAEMPDKSYRGAARVISVVPDSPADKADLQSGDLIVAINDNPVVTHTEVIKAISVFEPGDEVVIKFYRGDKVQEKVVALGERDHQFTYSVRKPHKWAEVVDFKRNFVGIHLLTLNDQLAAYFKVDGGVLVTEVVPDSPAEQAGIQAGDVITHWGDQVITDEHQLVSAIAETKADTAVNVVAGRNGETVDLSVIPVEREGQNRAFSFKNNYKFDFSPDFRFGNNQDMEKMREELDELIKEMDRLKQQNRR